MKSFEQLAKSAYEAYAHEQQILVGVSQRRPWASLPTSEKACWIAAARRLHAELAAIH